MQLPGVCCCCGRTIERDYVYCPWCGTSQVSGELVPVGVSGGSASVSETAGENLAESSRLSRIARSLDELERDFTLLAFRREKER